MITADIFNELFFSGTLFFLEHKMDNPAFVIDTSHILLQFIVMSLSFTQHTFYQLWFLLIKIKLS